MVEDAATLAAGVTDEDEARQRVGPPPAERCVQRQAGKYRGREDPVDARYPPLGRSTTLSSAAPVSALPKASKNMATAVSAVQTIPARLWPA